MHRSLPALLGLAIAAAAASATAPASAEEQGVAFKNLLGNIGIIPRERDPIRYRERAPLVLPPKASLPPPSASYASTNPQWPTDPDVAAVRRRTEEDRTPVTWSETRRMSDRNPTLSPRELALGRTAANNSEEPSTSSGGGNARSNLDLMIAPIRQGLAAAKLIEDDTAVAATLPYKEPSRSTLADPPTGYRKPANGKTITADSGGPRIDQQTRDANPINWLTQRFNRDEDE